MKRIKELKSKITYELVDLAVRSATKDHRKEFEVIKFNNLNNWDPNKQSYSKFCDSDPVRIANVRMIMNDILTGDYLDKIKYTKFRKRNTNGKWRNIEKPSFITGCYQHVLIELLKPFYELKDNNNGFNCKSGYGILANDLKRSFSHKVKSMFYERYDLEYYLFIDQRKCYEHITRKWFRKSLKNLTTDRFIIEFAVNVCYVGNVLPIGTSTSPLVHHICLLEFDLWVKSELTKDSARYADDNLLGFPDKDTANKAKWRIKEYWWYKYKVRAKSRTVILAPFSQPLKICGYKYYRLIKPDTHHNKGLMLLPHRTLRRMRQSNDPKSITSYIGLATKSDQFNELKEKLDSMASLTDVTSKLKVKYRWNAKQIDYKELIDNDIKFKIYDYQVEDKKGGSYLRMKIGFKVGNRVNVRILQGSYSLMIEWIKLIEPFYSLMDIDDLELEMYGSYVVFKNSIEIIEYLDE